MAETIEATATEAAAALAHKPTLSALLARIAEREPYTGPSVAAIVRQGRDGH